MAVILQYLSQFSGDKKLAVVRAMSSCMRLACVQALTNELNATPEPGLAKSIVKALGAEASIGL